MASDSTFVKLLLTGVVAVFALPGLIVEPGPFSELTAAGLLAAIWGLDWSGE